MARPRDPIREQERRRHILHAAARIFARDGFQGASIKSICREANISAGQLYYYFPSKEALIAAMAEADLAEVREFARALDGLEALFDAAVATVDPHASPPHGPAKLLAGSLAFEIMAEARRNPQIGDTLKAHFHAVSDLFGQRLADAQARGEVVADVSPVRLARLVGAMREGLLMLGSIDPALIDDDMKRIARRMLDRAFASDRQDQDAAPPMH